MADKQPQKLSDEDERWLKEHLASLPEAFNFDFEKATRKLIADQGIDWVKSRAELLKSQAEYIATLDGPPPPGGARGVLTARRA